MEESIKGKRVELDKNRPNIISGLLNSVSVPSVLLQNELVLHSNSSLGAFCSSDAIHVIVKPWLVGCTEQVVHLVRRSSLVQRQKLLFQMASQNHYLMAYRLKGDVLGSLIILVSLILSNSGLVWLFLLAYYIFFSSITLYFDGLPWICFRTLYFLLAIFVFCSCNTSFGICRDV